MDIIIPLSVLMLLAVRQEGHLDCKTCFWNREGFASGRPVQTWEFRGIEETLEVVL